MSTYGQLKTDVDNWLARDDVAVTGASFPSMTLLTEAELARDIRSVVQEQRTTLTTGATRYVDLPADFLELRQLFIDTTNGRRVLEYQTPQVIRSQKTWLSANGGVNDNTIQYFSIEGDDQANAPASVVRLVLAPEPDAANPQNIDLLYVTRWPALTADPDTNWLMQNHYDLYLWNLLKQAGIFLQETELAEKYDQMYQTARAEFGREANRKRFRGSDKVAYGNPRAII